MRSRREFVVSLGAAGTVAIAGCSGGGSPQTDGATTDTEIGADSTATESPVRTETETAARFSTTGNDAELIASSPTELLISQSDIPRDGYVLDNSNENETNGVEMASRTFANQNDSLMADVEVYDDVSTAESRYGSLDFSSHLGFSPDESQQLAVAVESEFATGSANGTYASYVRIRDANVFASLDWFTSDEAVGIQELGELAVSMHERWR